MYYSPLKIEGIQLLPSIITSEDEDQVFNDYWAIHTYHRIRCIDVEKSDCEIKNIRIANVKKIVLDKKVLGKIPLTKRLIFRLEEDSAYELYHITVMESIMNVNPEGVEFTNIEEWNNDSYFQ